MVQGYDIEEDNASTRKCACFNVYNYLKWQTNSISRDIQSQVPSYTVKEKYVIYMIYFTTTEKSGNCYIYISENVRWKRESCTYFGYETVLYELLEPMRLQYNNTYIKSTFKYAFLWILLCSICSLKYKFLYARYANNFY